MVGPLPGPSLGLVNGELFADLVVAEETVLPGVGSLEGDGLGLGVEAVVVGVLQLEGSTVERDAQDCLLSDSSLLLQKVPGVVDVQEDVGAGLAAL